MTVLLYTKIRRHRRLTFTLGLLSVCLFAVVMLINYLSKWYYVFPNNPEKLHSEFEEEKNYIVRMKPWKVIPKNLPFSGITCANYSEFNVKRFEHHYHIGDVLEIEIQSKDCNNKPKLFGGDLYTVRVFSPHLKASIRGVLDRSELGKYTYKVYLPWAGLLRIEVKLIFSAEVISYLDSLQASGIFEKSFLEFAFFKETDAMRLYHCGGSGKFWEKTCNLSQFNGFEPWYCRVPRSVQCSSYRNNNFFLPLPPDMNVFSKQDYFIRNFSHTILHKSTTTEIMVHSKNGTTDQNGTTWCSKTRSSKFPSGYFYHKKWNLLDCPSLSSQFEPQNSCLDGKSVLFVGDEISRLYFEIFKNIIGNPLKRQKPWFCHLQTSGCVRYQMFGHGLRTDNYQTYELYHYEEVIDEAKFNVSTIFVSLWSHFLFRKEDYQIFMYLRLRKFLEKTHYENPNILIVLLAPYYQGVRPFNQMLRFNDWFIFKSYQYFIEIFKKSPFRILNLWDMVQSNGRHSYLPHRDIIEDSMYLLINLICREG